MFVWNPGDLNPEQEAAIADYVDRSIMWTVRCGMAGVPCVIWVFGD